MRQILLEALLVLLHSRLQKIVDNSRWRSVRWLSLAQRQHKRRPLRCRDHVYRDVSRLCESNLDILYKSGLTLGFVLVS